MVNSADSQHWVPGEPATCTLKAEAYSWQTRQHLTSIQTAVHLPEGWKGITHLHGRPYIGANGVSWPPWKNGWKIKKRKHAKKRALFYVHVIFWEQSGQAGVENGAMLTTYLFRYTLECTISQSNFQNFLRLRRQRGIDPPSQNPADVPAHSWTSPTEGHWEVLWGRLWTPPQTTY